MRKNYEASKKRLQIAFVFLPLLSIMPSLLIVKKMYWAAIICSAILISYSIIDKAARLILMESSRYLTFCISIFLIGVIGSVLYVNMVPGAIPLFIVGFSVAILIFFQDIMSVEKKLINKKTNNVTDEKD